MFYKQRETEQANNSAFCNDREEKQEDADFTIEETGPLAEDPREVQLKPAAARKVSLPLRVLINVLIIVLKVILFVVGLAFNILSIITSLLGRLAGGILSILGTAMLIFWLFDRDMGTVVAVSSCVMIVAGGVIAAAPSLLATIGTTISAFSQSIKFL